MAAVGVRVVAAESIQLDLVATLPVDSRGVAGAVDGLDLTVAGRWLAASDNAATAHLFDLADPAGPIATGSKFLHGGHAGTPGHSPDGEMNAVAFSPCGRWLAGGVNRHGLRLWKVASGTEAAHLDDGHNCDGAAFSPDGRWIASAAGNRLMVRAFDDASGNLGEPVLADAVGVAGEVNSVDWRSDSRLLIAAGLREIAVYEVSGDRFKRQTVIPNEGPNGSVKSARLSPDGSLLAIGARDERARVLDPATGAIVADLPHEGNRIALPGDDDDTNVAIEAVAWAAEGRLLLTSGLVDGVVRVWRRGDWRLVATAQAQEANRAIETIDVAGDLVAIGGDEGVVRLYRLIYQP